MSFIAEQMSLVLKVKYVDKSHHNQAFGSCNRLCMRQG